MEATTKSPVRRWIEALRSGKYEQFKGALNVWDTNKCCCLGVACLLYQEELGDLSVTEQCEPPGRGGYLATRFDGKSSFLPTKVLAWLGLETEDGYFVDEDNKSSSLALHNDNGRTFEEIAGIIESKPKHLFMERPEPIYD